MSVVFLIITFMIYNSSIILISIICFKSIDLKKTLQEKKPVAPPTLPPEVPPNPIQPTYGDSYSRITGAVGAGVIASFIWGLGNAVLFKAFQNPGDIPSLLNGVGTFIVSSSALFAPYAFNQLSGLFPRPSN